jgi:hypothetical protein
MDIEEELKTKEMPLLEVLNRIGDIDDIISISDMDPIERANSRQKGLLLIPTRTRKEGRINILEIGFYKNSLMENICTLDDKFLEKLLEEYGNFRNAIV